MDVLTRVKDNCGFGLLASLDNSPTHQNVEDAITSLERMMHRGAIAADGKSGDGSGLLFGMPKSFMRRVALESGYELPELFAVGMLFLQDDSQKNYIADKCNENDLKVLFFRDVPIDTDALGNQALEVLPNIVQVFITPNSIIATKRFEALLYLTRKEIEHRFKDIEDFYIPSFSSRVISYKGLVMPTHIKEFYKDLDDQEFKTTFALFHQRFSTNTLPKWSLAQPFRTIAHNGEINSIAANRYNIKAKTEDIHSDVFSEDELKKLLPITDATLSDSGSLDNIFEFLIANGVDFFKATRALIAPPWQNAPYMDPNLRAYYEYMSTCFEAWDGPAAVSLTDGRFIGCVIDRNGLRPAKYIVTNDNRVIITSEYGVLEFSDDMIKQRGRLQSGQMIGIDLKYGKILNNKHIDDYLKSSNPYSEWLNQHMTYLQEYIGLPFSDISKYELDNLSIRQRLSNITMETIEMVIEPMISSAKESTGAMGDDTPLAAFSTKQRSFSDFFKQKFAQVTNPPIDPIREKVVMSLNTGFGETRNILQECPKHAIRLKAASPLLMEEKFQVLLSFGDESNPRYSPDYKNKTFSTLFEKDLQKSLEKLVNEIVESVKNEGVRVIILSDRCDKQNMKYIPMAMVIGRLNHVLLDEGVRHLTSTVAETSEVFDSHSCAVLIAYGANAVYPYLLYATVLKLLRRRDLSTYEQKSSFKNVHSAIGAGLLKIMSKMGISTIASYRNSSLFDVIGLSQEIVQECFSASDGLLSGLTYRDIEDRLEVNYNRALEITRVKKMFELDIGGEHRFSYNQEYHDYSPDLINALHDSCISGQREDYLIYRDIVNNRDKKMIRDFFTLKSDRKPISIDQVEQKDSIFKRFASAAMSLGSISVEAHEAIAEAMNKIGAMSNSGEGGEAPWRLKDSTKNSKIKQVASGRFGVTPEYLQSAQEIQIKVAQGAKPGEGGQLPGNKVTELIGSLRYTIPGVTLISPPPHHDIYSIEDLAQLIYDLKQVNPKAIITVKLVSTSGVGTIAAGVAKAYADKIIISGGDGGTGAAPLNSIKNAGNPWELGLIEAHNALKFNNLRGVVSLQTDGGLKSGLDVVKAALLGAESYGFGTVALCLVGCRMLRICHLNKCTVGVATQEKELRDHFVGNVDRIVNFFNLLAEDIREILAYLGYSSLEEIIGRSDLLSVIDDDFASKFDFRDLLRRIDGVDTVQVDSNKPFDDNQYEKDILKELYSVIQNPTEKITIKREITNLNRSFGALTSGEIAKFYGNDGLPKGSINFKLTGTAGQSLGAFLIRGINIILKGAGNDYVGKGMNGGKIVITPSDQSKKFSCAGNTCLYGATGGRLFIAGSVGERFGVRNSGAVAIIEGCGDHACEYMTGGVVVNLGDTGINFGAGMTGGVAFIYDQKREFIDNLNQELVEASRIDTDQSDEERHYIKKLLKEHVEVTSSLIAQEILSNFRHSVRDFWIVRPKDMKKVPLNLKESD
jgi:glutamate synthase (NADPH/NADH) large chain